MRVNLFVSRDIEEPYADIHTNELTENITKAMSILESDDSNNMLAVKKDQTLHFWNLVMCICLGLRISKSKCILKEANTLLKAFISG